jgi:DNA polymerase-3 subunit delta'
VDTVGANSLPWLASAQQRLRSAANAGRLPHSLLLLSAPGLGAEQLAYWIAGVALCESPMPDARPCGLCASCLLLRVDNHPDLHIVRLEEDAKQIKVDQVRELMENLSLKSYRGGFKVAIIEGAEALNVNGANAFLKTLEEPTADTVLILIARPTHRLPATIASRCLRISLAAPSRTVALEWLAAHSTAKKNWTAALALSGDAPLMAIDMEAAGLDALHDDMQRSLGQLTAGSVDVSLLAETWSRSNPVLRILWLENWITQRVRAAVSDPNSRQSAEPVRLPAALLKPKIRALFELLDAARDIRRFASTGMNLQLALEALLVGGREALAT